MFCSLYTKLLVSILHIWTRKLKKQCYRSNKKALFCGFQPIMVCPPSVSAFPLLKFGKTELLPAHLFGDTFGTPLRNCPIVWFHQLGCLHQKVVPLHMERLDSCQEERENKWKNANKDNRIPTPPTPLSLARSSHFILLFLGIYLFS